MFSYVVIAVVIVVIVVFDIFLWVPILESPPPPLSRCHCHLHHYHHHRQQKESVKMKEPRLKGSISFCMKQCPSMANSPIVSLDNVNWTSFVFEKYLLTSLLDFTPVNQPPKTIPFLYYGITFISQGLKGSTLPGGGIRIFASILHTHLAGEK